jgi:hypothetical protein
MTGLSYQITDQSHINYLSKVLEKVMFNKIKRYLITNNILVPEQFGFRKGISTGNMFFKLNDSVLKYLNKKMHVGGIFCDLAKAV